MISCYRRISHFVSANRRTLFCGTSKLSPVSDKAIDKLLVDLKHGETEAKQKYQMLPVGDNLVLHVSNSKCKDETVGCAILVGVGSEDSPDNRLGLPHLLEHVISSQCYQLYNSVSKCETETFTTVYSFEAPKQDYAAVIKIWAEAIFGTTDFSINESTQDPVKFHIEDIIEDEREKVDNEFHETRNGSADATWQVLKMCRANIHLPKFAYGNRDTLKLEVKELLKELNELRKLCRQRPAVICVYSAKKLKMKTIVKSLNVGHFLVAKKLPKLGSRGSRRKDNTAIVHRGKTTQHQHDSDIRNSLVVVRSDDDQRKLSLIFPTMNKFNIQESQTFQWIAEMIMCTHKDLLKHRLCLDEMITDCEAVLKNNNFVIMLHLTEKGLKNVKSVVHWVKSYLHSLHDTAVHKAKYMERTEVCSSYGFDELKTNMARAEHIVRHLDVESKDFDEENLYKGLSGEPGADLISKHLLKNKNVFHMITARDPKEVLRVLAEVDDCLPKNALTIAQYQTEPIYDTQFLMVEECMLDSDASAITFRFEDWRDEHVSETISYHIPLAKPEDVVLGRLFTRIFMFHIGGYNTFFHMGYMTPGLEKITYDARNKQEVKFMNIKRNPIEKTLNQKLFSLAKERSLLVLSEEMSGSKSFANSLMATIETNLFFVANVDPAPLQYKTLLNTTYESYTDYTKKIKVQNSNKKEKTRTPLGFLYNIRVESINTNERVTTTSIFYHVPARYIDYLYVAFTNECAKIRSEKDLYTVTCEEVRDVGFIEGLHIQILSIEAKNGQDGETIYRICNSLIKKVEKELEKEMKAETEPYIRVALDMMKKNQITIQVLGYKKPDINVKQTFNERFEEWIHDNMVTFKELKRAN